MSGTGIRTASPSGVFVQSPHRVFDPLVRVRGEVVIAFDDLQRAYTRTDVDSFFVADLRELTNTIKDRIKQQRLDREKKPATMRPMIFHIENQDGTIRTAGITQSSSLFYYQRTPQNVTLDFIYDSFFNAMAGPYALKSVRAIRIDTIFIVHPSVSSFPRTGTVEGMNLFADLLIEKRGEVIVESPKKVRLAEDLKVTVTSFINVVRRSDERWMLAASIELERSLNEEDEP